MAFLETDFSIRKKNKINLISPEFQCTSLGDIKITFLNSTKLLDLSENRKNKNRQQTCIKVSNYCFYSISAVFHLQPLLTDPQLYPA